MALPYEIADMCKECIKNHVSKKGEFKVSCKPIPKELNDPENPYYPIEKIIGLEKYNQLDSYDKTAIQLKMNKTLWAKEYLNWSTYNSERNFDQYYQREMLNCNAKLRVMRLGRRMGKCVDANTLVNTNKGKIKVSELNHKYKLLTYDYKNGKTEYTKKWSKSNNGNVICYMVETATGKKNTVSHNHPYLIKTSVGDDWVEAENLKAGDIAYEILDGKVIESEITFVKQIGRLETFSITVYPYNTLILDDIITHNTEVVTVDALHFAQNNPGKTVMVVGPFQNLIDEIFDRISSLLDNEESAFTGGYERKRQPNVIRLPNGSQIKGFTTGLNGDSIRGQSADRIYFDEAAYIPPTAFRSVLALLMDNPNVTITATSTPSALQTNFKNWCLQDADWREFHFQSTLFPYFHEIEGTLRSTYTGDDFALEVLAEFIEGSTRVFKSHNVATAAAEYNYVSSFCELKGEDRKDWIITIGKI
ncbi:MAG: terminase large subunit domain-containing protein [Paraclostridium sp.]